MIKILTVLFSVVGALHGARILGIVPVTSYSHQIVFQPLWKELSLRGHQVTTLTSLPINDPTLVNLTEIDLNFKYEKTEDIGEVVTTMQHNALLGYYKLFRRATALVDEQLQHPRVQQLLLDKNAEFDLVIVEYIIPAMFAFAKRFNCPHIGVLSFEAFNFMYEFLGNDINSAFYTDSMRPYSDKHTLFGRLNSVLYQLGVKLINYFYYIPANEAVVKKHFGDGYPSLWKIAQNASALFVNANAVSHKLMPLTPNVVLIGGEVKWNDTTNLTQELQHALDESEGFIYFSVGTNAKIANLPPKLVSILSETFAELPYTVLWKIDSDQDLNLSKNVITSRWFPQQAVLKHPKIKLFITQGGQQSMDEAMAYNVPMIGFPVYGDQAYNVQRMVEQGYGLSLDYSSLEKSEFKRTILEIIENPKYRNRLKELVDLAHDQQTTGLERAIWWTEFVIRRQGAKHLKNPFLDIPWYQYMLLDILAVCLVVLIVFLFVLYKLVKVLVWLIKMIKLKPKVD